MFQRLTSFFQSSSTVTTDVTDHQHTVVTESDESSAHHKTAMESVTVVTKSTSDLKVGERAAAAIAGDIIQIEHDDFCDEAYPSDRGHYKDKLAIDD